MKIRVVEAEDGITFQDNVNSVMDELSRKNPELMLYMEHGFRAIIKYVEELDVPETMSEKANAAGIYYWCNECPYFSIADDKRLKWGECPLAPYGKTRIDSEACEFFYKEMANNGSVEKKPVIRRGRRD